MNGGFQTRGVLADHLPAMAEPMKARLTFPLAWRAGQDPAAWRERARARLGELTGVAPDATPFAAELVDEIRREGHVARKLAFDLTADSRVLGLLLVPEGDGPFPAAVIYHDHGSRFDIGKEKVIETWGDDARVAASRDWAGRFFSGRLPGAALVRRGFVVLAVDALGWGDRGPLDYAGQQALAANMANLGGSLAGLMAQEDARAAAFLASLPQVDPARVAAVGFSMGGFRAWQAAALSDAVRAAVAVNWMGTARGLMVPGNNQTRGGSAWHMTHPGLLRWLDYPDVASLAAPKPLLCLAGEADPLFPPAAVAEAFGRMRKVWEAWGAGDRLETRIRPGGHVFTAEDQEAAFDWLEGWIGRGAASLARAQPGA